MIRLRPTNRPSARGFTLVELMVAVTGGLFVSILVFTLAKQGSRFYQRESRVANATLATLVGFQRLRADIARAGFLSTPNIAKDPRVCQNTTAFPEELKRLASVRIEQGGSPDNPVFTGNGLDPDAIVLSGSYGTVDHFPIRTVIQNSPNFEVYLQLNTGPMARIGYTTAPDKLALLQTYFPVGRVLRIVDRSGWQHFGVINGHGFTQEASDSGDPENDEAQPFVRLSNAAPLIFRQSGARTCGLKGNETGATASVINFVRYELRNLSDLDRYDPLYEQSGDAPFEDQRTELVREELDVTSGNPIAGTEELISEYAVNLDFGITVVGSIANGTDPSLRTLLPGDSEIPSWAGDAATITTTNRGPHLIRVVRVRLGARSREADRPENILDPNLAPGLYRIGLGDDGTAPFARVRTLQADVTLRNQTTPLWP